MKKLIIFSLLTVVSIFSYYFIVEYKYKSAQKKQQEWINEAIRAARKLDTLNVPPFLEKKKVVLTHNYQPPNDSILFVRFPGSYFTSDYNDGILNISLDAFEFNDTTKGLLLIMGIAAHDMWFSDNNYFSNIRAIEHQADVLKLYDRDFSTIVTRVKSDYNKTGFIDLNFCQEYLDLNYPNHQEQQSVKKLIATSVLFSKCNKLFGKESSEAWVCKEEALSSLILEMS